NQRRSSVVSDRSTHGGAATECHRSLSSAMLRRDILLTQSAICLTLMATAVSLSAIAGPLLDAARAHRWGSSFSQALFLAIVGFLIYGGLVYQVARLGHLRRLWAHRPADDKVLQHFFRSPHTPAVSILVPSYKEDPQVVRRTLLSAALQDYPNRRL